MKCLPDQPLVDHDGRESGTGDVCVIALQARD